MILPCGSSHDLIKQLSTFVRSPRAAIEARGSCLRTFAEIAVPESWIALKPQLGSAASTYLFDLAIKGCNTFDLELMPCKQACNNACHVLRLTTELSSEHDDVLALLAIACMFEGVASKARLFSSCMQLLTPPKSNLLRAAQLFNEGNSVVSNWQPAYTYRCRNLVQEVCCSDI